MMTSMLRGVTRGMPEELGCLVARVPGLRSVLRREPSNASAPLYITDINIPSVDGHELAQRATRLRPALKVLQLSGRERRRDGFDDPKGFLRGRLPRCVFPLAARPARSDLPNDRRCSVAGNSRPWRLLALSKASGKPALCSSLPRRCQPPSLNRKVERRRSCDLDLNRRVEMSTSDRSPKSPLGCIRFNKPAPNRACQ